MIQCPSCGKSLPDAFQKCQFCGADTSKVVRPAVPIRGSLGEWTPYQRPKWIWPTYYAICGYFVLSGILSVLDGLGLFNAKGEMSTVALVVGGFTIVFGLGLAARAELVRGIANVLCWLKIVSGALGFITGIMMAAIISPVALVLAVLSLLDIVTGGLMIFLIGETD